MFFGFSIMKNNATKLFASWISHFCLSCVSFGTLYFEFPWVRSWKWKWVADDTWSATFFLKDRNSVWKSNQPQWSINKQGNRYNILRVYTFFEYYDDVLGNMSFIPESKAFFPFYNMSMYFSSIEKYNVLLCISVCSNKQIFAEVATYS